MQIFLFVSLHNKLGSKPTVSLVDRFLLVLFRRVSALIGGIYQTKYTYPQKVSWL